MHWECLMCGIFFGYGLHRAGGAVISPCGSDKTAEVNKTSNNNVFTCSGLTSGVQNTWRIAVQGASTPYTAATCSSGTSAEACSGGGLGAAFSGYRESGTRTRLTIDATAINNDVFIRQGTLLCDEVTNTVDFCTLDYIVATSGSCSVQTGTGDDRYMVAGQCSLNTGATSARNRFRCEWYAQTQRLEENVTLTSSNYVTNCRLAKRVLPVVSGQYSYSVVVVPGNVLITAGQITVSRPPRPTELSCSPTGFIPVNTKITCTCTASDLGQPQGRLKWVKVKDSSDINYGNHGDATLQMTSQAVTLNDDNMTLFRCDVDWIEAVQGTPTYKAQIGVPPSQVTLTLNGYQGNQTVSEGSRVLFGCAANDGPPTSNVTLLHHGDNTQLASGLSPVTYSVAVTCQDGGQYYCQADNKMGPAAKGVPILLFVICSPRQLPALSPVNFTGNPLTFTFEVTANPVPEVTFAYLGQDCACSSGTPTAALGAVIVGTCVSSDVIYRSTCTVTVMNATKAGRYQIKATNTQGEGQTEFELYLSAATTDAQLADENSPTYLPVVVALAVVVALMAMMDVVVVAWLWKRGWVIPCSDHKSTERVKYTPEPVSGDGNIENASDSVEPQERGPYEDLVTSQVGLRSSYAQFGRHDNTERSLYEGISDYANVKQ